MGAAREFEIHQREEERATTLTVAGELDLATAPVLEDRLEQVRDDRRQAPRGERRWVVLDLSGLEFIDSTGVRVLFQAISDARGQGWRLELRGDLAPQVKQVIELTQLDRFWTPGEG